MLGNQKGTDVKNAQLWYESHVSKIISLKSSRDNSLLINIMPNWKQAFRKQNENYTTIETAILAQGYFTFIDPECKKKYEETKDPRFKQSLTRFVVRTDRKTNEKIGFLMTIMPSLKYLEETDFKPFHSAYLKRDPHFSGYIIYHDMNGKFVNGWKYLKGKITHTVTINNSSNSLFHLKSSGYEECTTTTYYVGTEVCTSYYTQHSEGDILMKTECHMEDEQEFSWEVCKWVPVDDGSGGYDDDDGGGTGGGGPSTSVAAIVKSITLDSKGIDLLNKALQQLLDQCGYETMYNFLTSNNSSISGVEYYDPAKHPDTISVAGYYAVRNTLVFHDNSTISNGLQEEFVHFFQNNIYPGGIHQYEGYCNIEFEAKLTQDILCRLNTGSCPSLGATAANGDDYRQWLLAVTNEHKTFPSFDDLKLQDPKWNNKNYWDFLRDFGTNPGNTKYNKPPNMTLEPLEINYVKNNYCN